MTLNNLEKVERIAKNAVLFNEDQGYQKLLKMHKIPLKTISGEFYDIEDFPEEHDASDLYLDIVNNPRYSTLINILRKSIIEDGYLSDTDDEGILLQLIELYLVEDKKANKEIYLEDII